MSLINLLSNAMLNVPLIGKRLKVARLNTVLSEVEHIKKQFNKPMVRFDDNMNGLYDCLKGLDMGLQEDIRWFLTLDITCYSKTSTEAATYLKRHLENGFPQEEHFFKNTSVGSLETAFMDWYSNLETAQAFVDQFIYVLDLYCSENPRKVKHLEELDEQDDVGGSEVYRTVRNRELNQSLIEFFNNNQFRLILDDFLIMVEVVIYSQLRRLNGQTI